MTAHPSSSDGPLARAEVPYRAVFAAATNLLALMDAEGRFVDVNAATLAALPGLGDIRGSDLVADPWDARGIVAPDREAAFERAIAGHTAGFSFEYAPDDETRLVFDLVLTPLLDDHGDVEYVLLEGTDVTGRERTARRATQAFDSLQAVYDRVSDAVVAVDTAGVVGHWNDRAAALFGTPPDDAVGRPLASVVPASVREPLLDAVETALDAGESTRHRVVAPDDSLALDVALFPAADGLSALVVDRTDELATERRLAEQEARHADLVEHLSEVVFRVDAEGRWRFLNPAWTAVLGHDVDGSLGDRFLDYVHPDDREHVDALCGSIMRGDRDACRTTVRFLTADDEARWVDVHARRTTGDSGAVATTGTIADVHERHEAEAELRRTTSRLATILQALPMAVIVEDETRTLSLANDAFGEYFDIDAPPEALVGTDCVAALDAALPQFADPEGVRAEVESLLSAREPAVGTLVEMADGRLLERSYLPTVVDGEHLGHIWLYADVTEVRRREHDLAAFKQVIDAADVGIGVTDDDGASHWYVNPAMLDLLGLDDPSEYLDASWEQFHDPEALARLKAETVPALRAGQPIHVESRIRRADGTDLPVDISLTPTADGQIVVFVRDSTERHEQEARLRRQNERLAEFASVVSHDLRNPLGVATGWLDLYRETEDPSALERVDRALDRMEALVTDLLALARNGQTVGDPAPTDLAAAVAEAWSTVDAPAATLTCETDATLLADEGRLVQALANLFRNAAEHAGPRVTVTVGTTDDGFYVEDDGPGIPADRSEQVFEHGFTTNQGGTGFGLAIVRAVAAAHGWSVRVVEGAAGGARFEFGDVRAD
jgi:PAS domain S-box-containing protein